MAGVDSTTWQRGYTYRGNKLNTSSNTGNQIINEGATGSSLNNPAQSYQNLVNMGRSPRDYGYGAPSTNPPAGDPSGGTGGGGNTSGGGNDSKSAWEDAYKKYIESLQKTRDEALAYRKGLYEQALANNGQYYKDEQRLANREYYTRNRKLAQMYGNDLTGPGLSNRYASSALLTNALTNAKNRQNTANRSAESEYHNALSNIQNAYAQGMYNAYGTEYGIDRNIEYQKYLLEHGYLG